jgi:C-terminal processing protease CtpA/Prc
MPARCSLQIIEIVGRGAADRAGLRVGDEIIAIDGDASVAVSRFAELRSGQVVTLTILRDGTTFALQLAAQP